MLLVPSTTFKYSSLKGITGGSSLPIYNYNFKKYSFNMHCITYFSKACSSLKGHKLIIKSGHLLLLSTSS